MNRFVFGQMAVLLGLGGCAEKEDSTECTSTRGTVSGMVHTDFGCEYTSTDARLEFYEQGDDTPLMIRPLEDGSYTVDLEAGAWEVRGFAHADTCITEEPIPVTVEACQSVTLDVCADLCVDG